MSQLEKAPCTVPISTWRFSFFSYNVTAPPTKYSKQFLGCRLRHLILWLYYTQKYVHSPTVMKIYQSCGENVNFFVTISNYKFDAYVNIRLIFERFIIRQNLPLSPRHVASLIFEFCAQKTVWSYLYGNAFLILAGR